MRYQFALMLALAFGMMSAGGQAHAQSIAGVWAGTGFVKSTIGTKEAVQCRVTYSRESGKDFGLSATCTTEGGKTKSVQGNLVRSKSNRYAGRISFGGAIVVTVKGNRQTLTVSSAMGTGRVNLVRR